MTAVELTIPPESWLTANRVIANRGYRGSIVQAIHALTEAAAHAQHLPPATTPVIVRWTVHYPKGVGAKADPTNAHPTCKAVLDALVPRWLVDDSPRFVVEERYRRGPNLDERGVHRIVLELLAVEG